MDCFSEEKREKFFRCVVGSIVDSDHKRKSDERQQWLLELIGQFKSAVQNSSETWTHQVLVKYRHMLWRKLCVV